LPDLQKYGVDIMNKKGQALAGLGQLALGVAVLCIVLTVAFMVLDQGRDQTLDNADTFSTDNQTVTVVPNTWVNLNTGCTWERDATVLAVYNNSVTPAGVLEAGNYTVSGYRINVSNTTWDTAGDGSGVINLSGINITYSCVTQSLSYNATVTLTNATFDIPGWVPLIIVTVVGVIMLGLIALFRGRRS
jgi:hypothetical protein